MIGNILRRQSIMSLKEIKSELGKTKSKTKIKLSKKEEEALISKYRGSRKITEQKFMTQLSKKKHKFPQPVRVQPTMEIFTGKDDDYTIAQRITKLSAKDVKKWGDKVIVDTKFDGCYDDITEVLTKDGWKLFKDLTKEDKVATLKDDKYLEYNILNDFIVEDFDGQLVHLENTSMDLMVTPNHMLYTQVIDKGGHAYNRPYELIRADSFERGKFKKNATWEGIKKDFMFEGVPGAYYGSSAKPKVKIPIELWVEFLGYWLSEGSLGGRSKKSYEICIAQSKEKSYEIMRDCTERLAILLGSKLMNVKDNIRFIDKRLWYYLKQFGKAKDKFVPSEIKELDSETIKLFLDSYTLGDGHKRDNYWRIYSISKRMVDDLQELALKAGYAANVYIITDEYIAPANSIAAGYKCAKLYATAFYRRGQVSRLETRIHPERLKNQKLEQISYKGKVYCVNVPNHVIYVRRNGKAVWCGNCRAMIVINPKTKDIRVLSRNLRTLKKFEKKYGAMIADNMSKLVKDKTVVDAELYALGRKGEILPGPTVTGWAKNPEAEKYSEIRPSIEVFDIMVLNSKDVREMPLKYRKRLLEVSLRKDDDRVMEFADTRLMSNNERLIYWLFNAKVNKRGFEGLVLKDPNAPMKYGKTGDMVKVKAIDTLDLRLKAVEAYPKNKVFKFYKHFVMTVEDADLDIKADKGIVAADFDHDFYMKFTQDLIRKWKAGELKAGKGGMVKVAAKYREIYGVDKVPRRLVLGDKGPIVEVFVEAISDNLKIPGSKIVRIRDDKQDADLVEDIVVMRDYLRGVKK